MNKFVISKMIGKVMICLILLLGLECTFVCADENNDVVKHVVYEEETDSLQLLRMAVD